MIHHLDSSVHGLGNKADPLRPFKKNVTFVFTYPLFLYISERGGFKDFLSCLKIYFASLGLFDFIFQFDINL